MNDQPKKLTLYSINDYLIDHLERRYAPPYSDRDYTCIRCGRAWDAKAAFAKKHWRVTPDGWIYGDDWTCSNCINPVVHFQDLLDAFPSRGSIQGIPLESGVHDCYWVLDRRCTNPEITRNNIPSAYSRDWESRRNCPLTICGAMGCHCFKFMRERYSMCVNDRFERVKLEEKYVEFRSLKLNKRPLKNRPIGGDKKWAR